MGSVGSREDNKPQRESDDAKLAADMSRVKVYEQKLQETYDSGRMEGFATGRISCEADYYETLTYVVFSFVFAWITTVVAMWSRQENIIQKLRASFEEKSKEHEAQLVTFKTAEQRIYDAEMALQEKRGMIEAQRKQIRESKKALQRERRGRLLAFRKYTFARRQLKSAYVAQQRLTAELASTRMASGIAAVGGLAVLLVSFGKQLLDHGHGSHSVPAVSVPVSAPVTTASDSHHPVVETPAAEA